MVSILALNYFWFFQAIRLHSHIAGKIDKYSTNKNLNLDTPFVI